MIEEIIVVAGEPCWVCVTRERSTLWTASGVYRGLPVRSKSRSRASVMGLWADMAVRWPRLAS